MGTPSAAKALAARVEGDPEKFPTMGPMGGTLLTLPFLVSDQLAAGTLLLIDANGIIGGAETIRLDNSTQATLQMDSSPGLARDRLDCLDFAMAAKQEKLC